MILRVMERCAVGEGMGAIKRDFIPSDSTIVKDDIKALVAYFCQPDEEGVSHGLEMKLVKNHSRSGTRRAFATSSIPTSLPMSLGVGVFFSTMPPEYNQKRLRM